MNSPTKLLRAGLILASGLLSVSLAAQSKIISLHTAVPQPSCSREETSAIKTIDKCAATAGSAPSRETSLALIRLILTEIGVDNDMASSGNAYITRLQQAEVRFRTENAPGISETKLVEALNQVVKDADAPTWLLTNTSEIHRLRALVKRDLPHLVSLKSATDQDRVAMAPSEALYLSISLFFQKVYSPLFRNQQYGTRSEATFATALPLATAQTFSGRDVLHEIDTVLSVLGL